MTDSPSQTELTATRSRDPRPRRWPRRLAILAIISLTLVYFLPTLVVISPFRQNVIAWATADLNGGLTIDSLSVGWLSPIRAQGIRLVDAQGEMVAQVDQLVTSNRLIDFLRRNDYGQIQITGPSINLQVDGQTSNLEQVLAAYMSDTSDAQAEVPQMKLVVVDGSLRLRRLGATDEWNFAPIELTAELGGATAPLIVDLSLTAADTDRSGNVAMSIQADPGRTRLTGSLWQARVQANHFPIQSTEALLQRMVGPVAVRGNMQGTVEVALDLENWQATVSTDRFDVADVAVSAPQWMGSDVIHLQHIVTIGQVTATPSVVEADRFRLETDFANFAVDGVFDLRELAQLSKQGRLPRSPFEVQGQVDLAQLARLLPDTAGLRSDVVLNAGTATLQASTRSQGEIQRMTFNLEAANINATQSNRQILWNQPLRVVGTVSENNGHLLVEKLSVDSDFVQLLGSGTVEAGNATIKGNLSQLTHQVGQFIQLEEFDLAGELDGRLNWQQSSSDNEPYQLTCDLIIDDPAVQLPQRRQWQSERVRLHTKTIASVSVDGQVGIEGGELIIQMGNEQLSASLTEPIDNLFESGPVRLVARMTGQLEQWRSHADFILPLPECQVRGDLTLSGVVHLQESRIQLGQLDGSVQGFEFQAFGALIQQPRMIASGNAEVDLATGEMRISQCNLAGSAVAAATDSLVIQTQPHFQLKTDVAYQADVNKVSSWFGYCAPGDDYQWNGLAEGQIQIQPRNQQVLDCQLTSTINNLVIYQKSAPPIQAANRAATQLVNSREHSYSELWREPKLVLNTRAAVPTNLSNVRLAGTRIDSKLAELQGHGVVSDLTGRLDTVLKGQWKPKWPEINQLIAKNTGRVIAFNGSQWRPFEIMGPLLPQSADSVAWVNPELSARTSVSWNQAELLRLKIEPSIMDVQLDRSVVYLSSASEGIVGQIMQVSPWIDLSGPEPLMNAEKGVLLDNLNVENHYIRDWLKYVAPVVADATSIRGNVTVTTDGFQIPLFQPERMTARGTVKLNDLQVGPGPISNQLLPMVDRFLAIFKPSESGFSAQQSWMALKQQTIPYVIQDGRVYHEGLVLRYKDVSIATKGSIGFDQTMDVEAEIPIQEKWLGREAWMAALKGQSVSIPIAGQLSQPKLNSKSFGDMTSRLLKNTTNAALNNVVTEQLQNAQSQFNEKVGKELNKVQGGLDQFQKGINQKLQRESDKLQEDIFGGLNRLLKGESQHKKKQSDPDR